MLVPPMETESTGVLCPDERCQRCPAGLLAEITSLFGRERLCLGCFLAELRRLSARGSKPTLAEPRA